MSIPKYDILTLQNIITINPAYGTVRKQFSDTQTIKAASGPYQGPRSHGSILSRTFGPARRLLYQDVKGVFLVGRYLTPRETLRSVINITMPSTHWCVPGLSQCPVWYSYTLLINMLKRAFDCCHNNMLFQATCSTLFYNVCRK